MPPLSDARLHPTATPHTPSGLPPNPPPALGPALSGTFQHLALAPLICPQAPWPQPGGSLPTLGRASGHVAQASHTATQAYFQLWDVSPCIAPPAAVVLMRTQAPMTLPAWGTSARLPVGPPMTGSLLSPHRAAAVMTQSCGTLPSMRSAWTPSPPSARGCVSPASSTQGKAEQVPAVGRLQRTHQLTWPRPPLIPTPPASP